ncbi:MAG: hypothetical protein K8R69_09845, partial [Deltaproteobacteria bacterium]|nr:hypothetical protein [Deltaproteobacteria bacterium]
EELPRILPTLALNTLFSSLAMGGTTLLSHRLRGALLNEETQSYLLLRHLGLRAGTTGGGGLLMLGASSLSERFSTGHWRAPRSEEIAETYANMLMWDAGAAGLRRIGNRFWWRAQLGPRLMRRRIQPLVSELMNRNPWLAQTPREQRALENYVGGRLASGQSIEAMELGLQDGLEPYWHQGEISFRPRTPVVRAPRPAGESPVASGRRRDVADEAVPPDQALPVENSPMDDIHNVPLEVLQGLWSLPMRPLPREILSSPLLRPIHQLRVGRQSFYLGRVIEGVRQRSSGGSESRRYVLALVPVEVDGRQVLKRRFFYVSSSDAGAWRSSPFMMGNAHIMKGMGRHYTQETQPVWEIAQALMRLEQRGPAPTQMPLQDLTRYISLSSEALGEAGERTMIAGFGQEIEFPAVPGTTALQAMQPGEVFALPPGWGWGSSKSIEATLRQMVNLRWPDGFIPDFTQAPTREMRQPTSLLGPLTFREYRGASIGDPSTGRRRPLVWIMGEDGQGRTWVRHLHYGDSEVNSYGVYSDVFDSGVLTSKPLEYADQAALLHEPYSRPFNAEYRDISPALTLLEPIRRYREARGLSPRLTPEDTPTILDINR